MWEEKTCHTTSLIFLCFAYLGPASMADKYTEEACL